MPTETFVPSGYDAVNTNVLSISSTRPITNAYNDTENSNYASVSWNKGVGANTDLYMTFDTSTIPNNVAITSVSLLVKGLATTFSSPYVTSCYIQACTGTTPKGTQTAFDTPGVYKIYTVDPGSWTRAEMANAGFLLHSTRGTTGANNNEVFNLCGAELTVDYLELDPPSLTLTSPINGANTTSASIVVAGTVNKMVDITVNVGGVDVATTTASGSFSMSVPVSWGSNTIIVTAEDSFGQTDSETVTVTRSNLSLIFDREQADVDRYNLLRSKLKAGTASASERTEYNGTPKGGYKAADLNRVGTAINTVASDLTAAGYPYDPQAKTNWANNSYFLASDMTTYLAKVQGLRDLLTVWTTTPAVPADVATYQQANAIEQIIADVNTLYHNMVDAYFYMGDLYMGEV